LPAEQSERNREESGVLKIS